MSLPTTNGTFRVEVKTMLVAQKELLRSGQCILLLVVMTLPSVAGETEAVRTITQLGGSVTRRGNDPRAPVIAAKIGARDTEYIGELESNLLRSGQHISSPRSVWDALAALTELESLDLSGRRRDHKELRLPDQMPTLSGLRKLTLDYRYLQLDDLTRALQHMPQLESLSLVDVEYSWKPEKPRDAGIDLSVLRHSPNLRELALDCVPNFQSLTILPSLEQLRLVDVYVVDVHPQHSPEWPQWKEKWRHLTELPKLTTIDMPPSVSALVALHEAGILHKFGGASTKDGQRPKSADDVVSFDLSYHPTRRNGPVYYPGLVWVDDAVLKALTSFPRLQSLNLTDTLVTDDGLATLTNWPQLRQISVRYGVERVLMDRMYSGSPEPPPEAQFYHRISDAGIARITAVPSLRALNLAGCRISGRAHSLILQRPEMNRLVIGSDVSDTNLQQLAKLTHLRTLSLSGDRSLTDTGFQALRNLTNLEELDLSYMPLSDQAWPIIRHFPRLRHLRISASSATGFGLAALSELKELRTLEIERAFETNGIDPGALSSLRKCPGLTRLWLDNGLITDGILKALRECGQLRALSTDPISDYQLPEWVSDRESPPISSPARKLYFGGNDQVTDAGLAELATLTELEELTLDASGVRGPGLKSLANLPRLKSLSIDISDDVLEALNEVEQLHLLPGMFGRDGGRPVDAKDVVRFDIPAVREVNRGPVTARGLAALKPLTQLHTLRYFSADHQVDDDCMKALSDIGLLHALPQAKTENGGRPTDAQDVITLTLGGAQISEAVFPAILQFTNLRELRINLSRPTNLTPLAALKRLEILHVYERGKRAGGIDALKKLRPDLRIRSPR